MKRRKMDLNPWDFENLDMFLYYCCPNCDHKYQSKTTFIIHAFEQHREARQSLTSQIQTQNLSVLCENVRFFINSKGWIDTKDETEESEENLCLEDEFPSYENELEDFEVEKEEKLELAEKVEPPSEFKFEIASDAEETLEKFHCESCPKIFNSMKTLKLHQKKFHQEPKVVAPKLKPEKAENNDENLPFICHNLRCRRKFESEDLLQEHIKENHPFSCRFCQFITDNKENLISHLNRTHKAGLEDYFCNVCDMKFLNNKSMNQHKISEHGGKFVCRYCLKKFQAGCSLRDHVESFHENVKHVCDLCGRSYSNIATLRKHKRSMHEGKKFQCQHCGKEFNYRQGMESHIEVVHENKKYDCKICGKFFNCKPSLTLHMHSHNSQKEFKCKHCEEVFKSYQEMRWHYAKIHSVKKSYPCEICQKPFPKRSYLKDHVNTVHNKARDYVCDICGKAVSTKSYLTRHRKLLHNVIDKKSKESDDEDEETSDEEENDEEPSSEPIHENMILVQTQTPTKEIVVTTSQV